MFLKPVITEKSLKEAANRKYTFRVDLKSTKPEIKGWVEKIFKVNVLKVQTIVMPGKTYRSGKKWVYRSKSDFKKAIVTIKPEQKIELFDVVAGGAKQ